MRNILSLAAEGEPLAKEGEGVFGGGLGGRLRSRCRLLPRKPHCFVLRSVDFLLCGDTPRIQDKVIRPGFRAQMAAMRAVPSPLGTWGLRRSRGGRNAASFW